MNLMILNDHQKASRKNDEGTMTNHATWAHKRKSIGKIHMTATIHFLQIQEDNVDYS